MYLAPEALKNLAPAASMPATFPPTATATTSSNLHTLQTLILALLHILEKFWVRIWKAVILEIQSTARTARLGASIQSMFAETAGGMQVAVEWHFRPKELTLHTAFASIFAFQCTCGTGINASIGAWSSHHSLSILLYSSKPHLKVPGYEPLRKISSQLPQLEGAAAIPHHQLGNKSFSVKRFQLHIWWMPEARCKVFLWSTCYSFNFQWSLLFYLCSFTLLSDCFLVPAT